MSRIVVLKPAEQDGDTRWYQLTVDGEPYALRTEWRFMNFEIFKYHWPCHFGGTSLLIPLDSDLMDDVFTIEAFIFKKPILSSDGSSPTPRSIMVDLGEWLLSAWHPDLLDTHLGWIRFEIDLSHVAVGPTEQTPRAIRIVPKVDIKSLPI